MPERILTPRGRADLCEERSGAKNAAGFLQSIGGRSRSSDPLRADGRAVGSIAHPNLEGGGDLDLHRHARRRVWSVTGRCWSLAKPARQRRLCATCRRDSRLALEQEDLFVASQIIHLRPLVGWDVYRRFVAANPFVARFTPTSTRMRSTRLRRPAMFDTPSAQWRYC
jgi:hypothetical protein